MHATRDSEPHSRSPPLSNRQLLGTNHHFEKEGGRICDKTPVPKTHATGYHHFSQNDIRASNMLRSTSARHRQRGIGSDTIQNTCFHATKTGLLEQTTNRNPTWTCGTQRPGASRSTNRTGNINSKINEKRNIQRIRNGEINVNESQVFSNRGWDIGTTSRTSIYPHTVPNTDMDHIGQAISVQSQSQSVAH